MPARSQEGVLCSAKKLCSTNLEHSPSPVEDETGVIKSDYESLIEGNPQLAPIRQS